jgi:valyl-tRNA synthetase
MGKRLGDPIYAGPTTSSSRFHMVLPPPNVTGNLHIGHALTVTIEDVLCRYHRQLGHEVALGFIGNELNTSGKSQLGLGDLVPGI